MASTLEQASRKVSGRGGWKTAHFMLSTDRELNYREQTAYERYCDYCRERLGCEPAADWVWYVELTKIPSV